MIMETSAVRGNQLSVTVPLRKYSDGALLSMQNDANVMANSEHSTSMSFIGNYSPSGGRVIFSNGENDRPLNLSPNTVASPEAMPQRKPREFIPDSDKDDAYRDRRRRNNEAAKKSRNKRREQDKIVAYQVQSLTEQNKFLFQKLVELSKTHNFDLKEILSQKSENDLCYYPPYQEPYHGSSSAFSPSGMDSPDLGQLLDHTVSSKNSVMSLNLPSVEEAKRKFSFDSRLSETTRSTDNISLYDGPKNGFESSYMSNSAFQFFPKNAELSEKDLPANPFMNCPNTVKHLDLPPQDDARRRHSCGSRPYIEKLDVPNGDYRDDFKNSSPDLEKFADGLLTPPKEESSNVGQVRSVSPSLPHKLRHKAHLNDKEAPSPTSQPPSLILSPNSGVAPVEGVSLCELKQENDELRSQLHHYSNVVASLQTFLNDSGVRKRKKSVFSPNENIVQTEVTTSD